MSEAVVKNQVLNEFDQPVKGVSLWMDAWRRLKKNKMAMLCLVVIILYGVVSLAAPILPIHSYKFQVVDHQFLTTPSWDWGCPLPMHPGAHL